MTNEPPHNGSASSPTLASYATLGTTMAASVAIGLLLGVALDSWLKTSPALLFVGLFLGIAGAVASVRAAFKRWT